MPPKCSRTLETTAEMATRHQQNNLEQIVWYVWTLVEAGEFLPTCCIQYNARDETAPKIRLAFEPEDSLKLRVCETDGYSANLKAEILWSGLRLGWKSLQVLCAAHRCHTVADKTWDLFAQADGGLSSKI